MNCLRNHDNALAQCKGLFGNPIIADIIANQWFRKNKEALNYKDAFNPLPAPVIALVVTAVLLSWVAQHSHTTDKLC